MTFYACGTSHCVSPLGQEPKKKKKQKAGPVIVVNPNNPLEQVAKLIEEQKRKLHEMLRVDHSGEIAANTIYLAQSRMFNLLGDKATGKMCIDMLETEKKHLKVAEKLLHQHRVRPSALNSIWGIAGSFLGAGTALFGKEGAMAATEAVETVIGEHYDGSRT